MTQQTFDLAKAQQRIATALEATLATANAVAEHLAAIDAAMQTLKAAGMYAELPSREAFESRNGSAPIYLYHYFPQGRDGDYLGPGGKRKVYVGCDPKRIAEARRLVENRKRWVQLQRERTQLSYELGQITDDVTRLVKEAESLARRSWKKSDLAQPADLATLVEAAQRDLAAQRGGGQE